MSDLRLELLGTFRLTASGLHVTRFATDKVRALLAYLAVEADRPHQRVALATLLWSEQSDVGARNNLRKALHQLRQTLDGVAPAGADAVLEITRHTARVKPGAIAVDVAELNALLDAVDAHGHGHLHTCGDCLARLTDAAALYRGEVLSGFGLPDAEPFEEWLQVLREAVQQRVLMALHRAAAAHMRRGEYEAARELAAQQVRLASWREEAYVQLMQALAVAGERGEALAVYERCRAALADSLGVEPNAETSDLYELMLAGGDIGAPERVAPRAQVNLHGFPAQDTAFVGRSSEMLQLRELLMDPECRLITVTGPGGAGKTRMALRAAGLAAEVGSGRLADDGARPIAGPADGIYFVPLEGVDDARRLPEALATGLLILPREREEVRDQLLAFLRPRECILVLDNFEQLVSGADLLADMLAAAPGLRLLVTSREVLRLRGEHILTLSGLDYPEQDGGADVGDLLTFGAGQLFMRTARRLDPAFTPDAAGARAVLRICHLVQGLPLAIEMAAAWTGTYDIEEIANQIERGAEILVAPWRDTPERHSTVRHVFEHSWQLLAPAERRLLAQLTLFAGEFDLEAVLAVTGAGAAELAALLDKSLLRRVDAGRYALHPLLRQYAAHELAALDAVESGAELQRNAHREYFLGLVAGYREDLEDGGHASALVRLTKVQGDLRQAWRWSVAAGDFRLLAAAQESLARYYEISGKAGEAADVFAGAAVLQERLVEDSPAQDVDVVVEARLQQARFDSEAGVSSEALGVARAAVELADARGSDRARGTSRTMLSFLLSNEGEYEAARTTQEIALALLRTEGDERALGRGLIRMGQIYLSSETTPEVHRRRLLTAVDYLEEGKAKCGGVNDLVGTGIALHELALTYARLGRFKEAIACVRGAIASLKTTGDRNRATRAIGNLGFFSFQAGDDEQAMICFRQSLQQAEKVGARLDVARTLGSLTLLHRRRGELDEARVCIDRALGLLEVQGPRAFHDALLLEKAEVLVASGALDAAEPLIQAGVETMLRIGHPDHVIQGRVLSARIASARGDAGGAVGSLEDLLAEADAPELEAPVRFELWRLTGDEAHRAAATRLYGELYAALPDHDSRLRLDALGAPPAPEAG